MRVVMFYHSLISDWNHGNAHFLRGVATELIERGHYVDIYEDVNAWSVRNLVQNHGTAAIEQFHSAYPQLRSLRYEPERLDLDKALDGADLVLVHEWNAPELVNRVGAFRARHGGFVLLFHDTHHRAVTDPRALSQFDLAAYDGVLAFGRAIADAYIQCGWAKKVWTWHEAADTRVFHMQGRSEEKPNYEGDLIWIGNWGDEERTEELREFLLRPAKALGLKACVYGVRYPYSAVQELTAAGIEYRGWLPNFEVPRAFSRFRTTVHVPRRPYVKALPGIPTIRVFEALACGIPLVSAYWPDSERLFTPGIDYLVARNGAEMVRHLGALIDSPEAARTMAEHGRQTIAERHTCAHRVDELLAISSNLSSQNREALV